MVSQQFQDFTHVSNYPQYMRIVEQFVLDNGKPGQSHLDMPAGNGLLADNLIKAGFNSVCGDFNSERPNYIYVNMEKKLSFENSTFDFVTCMEGIEHVINPSHLVEELSRIVKSGGYVVITMPNVQNFYSRLKFLFTGSFYQFEPEFTRHPNGKPVDRGHISPLTYAQLNYLFVENNLQPVHIDGDKFKKKILMPIFLILAIFNSLFYRSKIKAHKTEMPYALMNNKKFFFSRSLVAVWKKL
jgi:SAM-dependent methyltransferase